MPKAVSRPSKEVPPTSRELRDRTEMMHQPGERLGEEILAYRFKWGLDLWTGVPLTGKDAEEWHQYHYGRTDEIVE